MAISGRKLYLMAAAVMVLIGAVAWIAKDRSEIVIRDQVGEGISTILDVSHEAVGTWIQGHRVVVELWADSEEVLAFTQRLVQIGPDQSALLSDPAQTGAREFFAPILVSRGYRGYFLIGRDGLSVSSTRDENVGTPNLVLAQPSFLGRIWEGESVMSTPMLSDVLLVDEDGLLRPDLPTMFVGAPIRDAGGDVVAALTFRIDPVGGFTAVLQSGRSGETGETYAFDREGRLISDSRFEDQLRSIGLLGVNEHSILNVSVVDPGVDLVAGQAGAVPLPDRPLTRMAADAVAMRDGIDLDGYRDYRGVEVVGAWLWDEDLGFGIASEIDVAEAFSLSRSVTLITIGATVFVELLIVGLVLLFVRYGRILLESREQLRDVNAQLADQVERLEQAEVDRRTHLYELERSNLKLERSNLDLEEFASIAAHDMQEPLRKVEIFADRIVVNSADDLTEQGLDDLERLGRSVQRMRRLIDDLLTYSRVSTRGREFESVDLGILASDVVDGLYDAIEKSGGEVTVAHLPVIDADRMQMSQLFGNLIGNALKFHRPGVPPQVSLESQIVDDDVIGGAQICRLTIRDNGIGFDEDHIDQIFSMFGRLHGRDEYSGTGIGLPMCRRIAQRHGGEITATSIHGEGSTFTVNLPVTHDTGPAD